MQGEAKARAHGHAEGGYGEGAGGEKWEEGPTNTSHADKKSGGQGMTGQNRKRASSIDVNETKEQGSTGSGSMHKEHPDSEDESLHQHQHKERYERVQWAYCFTFQGFTKPTVTVSITLLPSRVSLLLWVFRSRRMRMRTST